MRRTTLPIAACLSLSLCLAAQEPAGASEATAQYKALVKEFTKAQSKHYAKLRTARSPAAQRSLQKQDPAMDFIPKFQEAAARYAETPAAIPFLTWLIDAERSPENDVSRDALANLVVDHLESDQLQAAVLKLERGVTLVGQQDAHEALDEIYQGNPHQDVKAAALYVRSMIAIRAQGTTAADKKTAVANLKKVLEMAPESTFAAAADGILFEQNNLQIGQTAPDIVGKDLDGVAFKLSDYRGKVILLDFWGDW